jgi:hypothetical protein
MIEWFRTRRHVPACRAVLIVVVSLLPCAAGAQSAPAMPRVRSEDRMIAQLIAEAPAASVTFRGLVAAIDATNGIVYVEPGQCRYGSQACLVHSIQVAGPHRILRVVVNTRRDLEGLIGAIGHELQHAMEVLSEPGITTTQGMFFRLFGMSMSTTGRFESKEAVEAGIQIEHELRTTTKAGVRVLPPSRPGNTQSPRHPRGRIVEYDSNSSLQKAGS